MDDLMNVMPLPLTDNDLQQLVTRLNTALESRSDKDWNYSRIYLSVSSLEDSSSPYFLWPEVLDLLTKQGRSDLKTLSDEVKWGERHSSELGMLELVSLRINKALLESTSDGFWQNKRPVLRIVRKHLLLDQGVPSALWYAICEVGGEDFDNR
jgi:hypothetical protein